jgi:predicted PurR-regulated permease PerM
MISNYQAHFKKYKKNMETTMFALGVLSMVAVILITAIVVGMFKVIKIARQVQELNQWMSDFERNVWQQVNGEDVEIHRRIDGILNDVPRAINDQITDSVTQCNSYTDKRIDKLIDTYFMVKESKQILNEDKRK